MKNRKTGLTVVQQIQGQIIHIPGRPLVMLTREVAELYQVGPRQITQAVRRNPDRFPERYVFELTEKEITWLQNENRLSSHVSDSYNVPLAFTREGANMLSTVLRSKIAVERAIQIVDAFTALEREAERIRTQRNNLDWQQKRLEGKIVRRELTDAIDAFNAYATAQNPDHKFPYYIAFSRETNKALFILENGKAPNNFRDLLDGVQLLHQGSAESIIIKTIYDEMEKDTEYHEIFKIAMKKVRSFAEAVGKTLPGQHKALRPAPLALAAAQ